MKKYIPFSLAICTMISFFLLTQNAFTQTSQSTTNTSTYVKGITSGRAKAMAIGVLGLISLVIAWRAKLRVSKNSSSRNGVVVAFVLSLSSIILSVIHLMTSAGAVFGSGSGKAGALVALLFGLIGAVLSGLALQKKTVPISR